MNDEQTILIKPDQTFSLFKRQKQQASYSFLNAFERFLRQNREAKSQTPNRDRQGEATAHYD